MTSTPSPPLTFRQRRLGPAAGSLALAGARALEADGAFVFISADRATAFVGHTPARTFVGADGLEQLLSTLLSGHVINESSDVALAPIGAWGRAFFDHAPQNADWAGFADATGFIFAETIVLRDGVLFEQRVDGAPAEPAAIARRTPLPDQQAVPAYVDVVARAVASIERGDLEKVVCARSATVILAAPPANARLLDALLGSNPNAALFALKWQGALFVGATPERLVELRDGRVCTMALAGSRNLDGHTPEAELAAALLDDAKERAEHEFVVAGICKELAPFVDLDPLPATAEVAMARGLMHLRTPISGRLKPGASPTAIVHAMHPTPALGGTPREAALRFISENEGDLRGWYGSPLGWIDANGNLEFAVALRSALVRGRHAVLYAGAGIVRGSTPERELAETDAKLFAMRELLRQLENG